MPVITGNFVDTLAMPPFPLPSLAAPAGALTVSGLRGGAPAWLIAELAATRPCLCVVADEHLLAVFEQDLRLFTNQQILLYPAQEIPPYTPLSPDQRITAARLASLYLFREGSAAIMVTSVEALLRRVMPISALTGQVEYLVAGEECEREELLHRLEALGYEQVALVQTVGDYSVRGGIIDIFPPPFVTAGGQFHDGPIRLDFFGDRLESLRPFDPFSQRSMGTVEEAILLPVADIILPAATGPGRQRVREQFYRLGEKLGWNSEETARLAERGGAGSRFTGMELFLPLYYQGETTASASVLDYLPAQSAIVLVDPEGIQESMGHCLERIARNYAVAVEQNSPALPPNDLFLTAENLGEELSRFRRLRLSDFPRAGETAETIACGGHGLLRQEIATRRAKEGLLVPLSQQISDWLSQGDRVVVCCRSERHRKNLAELLSARRHEVTATTPPLRLAAPLEGNHGAAVQLCAQPLSAGFSLPQHRVHLLSESELFGARRLGGKRSRKEAAETVTFTELHDGEVVVHRDHGLGIYRGLQTIELAGVTNDFMLLEYRDGDKLYLPVDRLNLISRYQGLSDREPKIDKLGSQSWKSTKAKVKEEVWRVAQELLRLYATREIREGRRFSPPGALFHDLEESFAYDETPGQLKAINDVLDDLGGDRPMDRLICGDVGYGKTEVAVRAAFKVVEDGAQVAILVPTTVLAEQHLKTFRERLKDFPVQIGCLNRFRSSGEQRQLLKDLAHGRVDIVIGTHRLLSKDVAFRNLGLLVIDEEHRFGVAHKEKLKKLRAEVDILTLTATPIPRTLQMSLLGIRDLSVIATPPEHRQPIKTFVARYDELVIKEAISRELRRGGQVFVVHNRVKSIHRMAGLIARLVPEARIAVAHGQMAGKELEEIMVSFVTAKVNVLVSTTIIESGLDIPAANTIIINRADTLGLAEIYQLRGRVGRAATQSFAYLLVPSLDNLSKDSRERLRALMDYNDLGGGFKLAMSDLQIRGGGNLLGVSQSGNIAAIGYELYLDLLQKTVADLKAEEARDGGVERVEELDPEVNLQLSAYIPESYIPDINQRYLTYRRLAALIGAGEEAGDDLHNELVDRYGPLPAETGTLFRIIALKKALATLRIGKLEQGRDTLVFTFLNDTPIRPERLLAYVASRSSGKNRANLRFTQDGRLILSGPLVSTEHIFTTIISVLDELDTLRNASS
jgi:transcription-repair coupling factor (superfamily II helicase)